MTGNKMSTYNLGYEYDYGNLWVYYTFQIIEIENNLSISSFNMERSNQSLSSIHQFEIKGKSLAHFLWLGISILVTLFILITLVFAIKTPLKKKWVWILFILFGIGAASLNWTTGEFEIKILTIKLFWQFKPK